LTSIPASVKLYGTRNVGEITTQLNNADYKLLPNTNVTVVVITAEHTNALIAPREAVRTDDNQAYVYRVAGNELHRQPIQTSIFNLTQVEITKGLSEKETVALSALNNKPLRDGQPVKVVQ
jgi:HlyD family secretion protein